MANLRSAKGVAILRRYVKNWFSILLVYLSLKKQTRAKFKDGYETNLSKSDLGDFYENLYTRYLQDNGFRFERKGAYRVATLPNKMQLLIKEPLYAFVLDEVFLTKTYGQNNLSNRPVIDIGATIADSAIYFYSQGAAPIYGFEIHKPHYDTALENIRINNLDQKITMYNEPATADKINKLILDEKLEKVFIKMDCEGCEHEIIPHLDFTHVTDIVLEYHGDARDLVRTLKTSGYNTTKKGGMIYASKTVK